MRPTISATRPITVKPNPAPKVTISTQMPMRLATPSAPFCSRLK